MQKNARNKARKAKNQPASQTPQVPQIPQGLQLTVPMPELLVSELHGVVTRLGLLALEGLLRHEVEGDLRAAVPARSGRRAACPERHGAGEPRARRASSRGPSSAGPPGRTRGAASDLADLVERGVDSSRSMLFVIDGAKALRRAIVDVFGKRALIQRCQVHKRRNILEHLPEEKQTSVGNILSPSAPPRPRPRSDA